MKCKTCRWNLNDTCSYKASDFYNQVLENYDDIECDQYYPENDMELFSSTDEDTESLFKNDISFL